MVVPGATGVRAGRWPMSAEQAPAVGGSRARGRRETIGLPRLRVSVASELVGAAVESNRTAIWSRVADVSSANATGVASRTGGARPRVSVPAPVNDTLAGTPVANSKAPAGSSPELERGSRDESLRAGGRQRDLPPVRRNLYPRPVRLLSSARAGREVAEPARPVLGFRESSVSTPERAAYSALYRLERHRGALEILLLLRWEGRATSWRMRSVLRPGPVALRAALESLISLGLVEPSGAAKESSFPFGKPYQLSEQGGALLATPPDRWFPRIRR